MTEEPAAARSPAGDRTAPGPPSPPGAAEPGVLQPVVAGLSAAVIGFAGSFTIVLAGLRAAGATPAEGASGLLALSVAMGAVAIGLGLWTRMPIGIAWSTPGAALLIADGPPAGGWPAAVGAFAACGVLLVLAGLWRPLGRAIGRIPGPLAAALLAGVLLPVCLAPARAVVAVPGQAGPVVVVWAVLGRVAPRLAVPGALVAAGVAVAIDPVHGAATGGLAPTLVLTAPTLHLGALLGLGVPLFVVTMASQNVAGMAVLTGYGFRPDLRRVLTTTGAATALVAPAGGHAINLAAITAALAASPDAHPDPGRRWIASVSAGAAYLVLGLGAGLATAGVAAAPPVLVEAVAGLALLGALGGALSAATASPAHLQAAVATLVVGASGITALGLSAPFWGLLAGLALLGVARVGRPPRG